MKKRPNLLLFNPDQWRGDVLGHIGNPAAQTPVLDECVRRDFVSFSRAFCQNPVCTPSRCSLMTGWYPHVRGHRTMHHMLRPDEPCLLKILKENGYFVWWGGKNDLVPRQNGFADYCDVKFSPSPADFKRWGHAPRRDDQSWRGTPEGDNFHSFFAGKLETGGDSIDSDGDWANILGALDCIQNYDGEQPFCLYLPLGYPHPPYRVEEPFFGQIERDVLPPRIPTPAWDEKPALLKGIAERQNLKRWDETRWDELRATYYGMCSRVDFQFGLVLDALRERDFYDDTAAFFFSDHGDFTGDYGLVEKTQNTFEDCLTRVPFLIKPPRNIPVQPRVCDALVELVDLSATVYDWCEIEPNYSHFGRSLGPLGAGENRHRDAVFCEGGRLENEAHCMETESDPGDDPNGLYWPRLHLQRHIPEHSKAVMCRTEKWKYVRRLYENDELYDLENDPCELENRINDADLAPVVAELRARLLTFFLETGDVVPHDLDRR